MPFIICIYGSAGTHARRCGDRRRPVRLPGSVRSAAATFTFSRSLFSSIPSSWAALQLRGYLPNSGCPPGTHAPARIQPDGSAHVHDYVIRSDEQSADVLQLANFHLVSSQQCRALGVRGRSYEAVGDKTRILQRRMAEREEGMAPHVRFQAAPALGEGGGQFPRHLSVLLRMWVVQVGHVMAPILAQSDCDCLQLL